MVSGAWLRAQLPCSSGHLQVLVISARDQCYQTKTCKHQLLVSWLLVSLTAAMWELQCGTDLCWGLGDQPAPKFDRLSFPSLDWLCWRRPVREAFVFIQTHCNPNHRSHIIQSVHNSSSYRIVWVNLAKINLSWCFFETWLKLCRRTRVFLHNHSSGCFNFFFLNILNLV